MSGQRRWETSKTKEKWPRLWGTVIQAAAVPAGEPQSQKSKIVQQTRWSVSPRTENCWKAKLICHSREILGKNKAKKRGRGAVKWGSEKQKEIKALAAEADPDSKQGIGKQFTKWRNPCGNFKTGMGEIQSTARKMPSHRGEREKHMCKMLPCAHQ